MLFKALKLCPRCLWTFPNEKSLHLLKLTLIFFFNFCSFEQEENEMKMMSCIFDDEEVSTSSSSSISDRPPNQEKMNLKSRFIKKKSGKTGQKVQRSASAILRSKMYAVVHKKKNQKLSKTLETDQGNFFFQILNRAQLF